MSALILVSWLLAVVVNRGGYEVESPWLTGTGLRKTITGEGVWRIRRQAGSPGIEVFRVAETGHGGILTDEFVAWRTGGAGGG